MTEYSSDEIDLAFRRLGAVVKNFHGAVLLENEERRWVMANEAFYKLFNPEGGEAEHVGVDLRELGKTTRFAFGNPDDFITRVEQLISGRVPVVGEEVTMADGRVLERDYIPVYAEERFLGHLWVYRDITSRKSADETARLREERYRLLAENMLDLVALHDIEGTFLYVSPSYMHTLGFAEEELIGHSPYDFFHPDDVERIKRESHAQVKLGMEIFNFEYRIRRKDGRYIWFSTNTKAIRDSYNNISMIQTVSRDVTERVKTLRQLEEMNTQKDKLFSIIAHDLRSPVSNCVGLVTLLQMEFEALTPQQEQYFAYLRESLDNLQRLLDDLLLWSKNQFDKVPYEPVPINLHDEIESTVRQLVEMTRAKDIKIDIQTGDDYAVFADRNMLSTILRNLLSNAIKFSDPSGQVDIVATHNGNEVQVAVRDYGVGMTQETLKMLFSDGAKISTLGTRGEKGTGFGLELCKYFVDKHGGAIWALSEEGKGSTFYFTIPISA